MPEETESQNKEIIAKGGKSFVAIMEDGTKEEVLVRLLKIRQLPAYFEALEDEVKLISVVTGKDEAWAELLDFDSQLALVEVAKEVNFTRAKKWAERRAQVAEDLAPIAGRAQRARGQLMKS